MTEPINMKDVADKLKKSIQQKTDRLAHLVVGCDPPPASPPGTPLIVGWMTRNILERKIQDVMGQVGRNAKVAASEGQELDVAYEAELMKAIEAFTRILNAQLKKPLPKKILVPNKGLVTPLVMPTGGRPN